MARMSRIGFGIAADYIVREQQRRLPPQDWIPKNRAVWDKFFNRALIDSIGLLECADSAAEHELYQAEFHAIRDVMRALSAGFDQQTLLLAYELEDSPEAYIERPARWGVKFRTGFLGSYTLDNPSSLLARDAGLNETDAASVFQARESFSYGAYEKTRFIFKLKAILNRARPFQCAGIYRAESKGFRAIPAHSAWSGSAPSGHCIESAMAIVATLVDFRRRLPALAAEEKRLLLWAARSGDLRVWAGLHFVTDNIISFVLALRAVRHVFAKTKQPYARELLKGVVARSVSVGVARKMVRSHRRRGAHVFSPFLNLLNAELRL
jgi:hypothetical protein